jgi:hypothetical protein
MHDHRIAMHLDDILTPFPIKETVGRRKKKKGNTHLPDGVDVSPTAAVFLTDVLQAATTPSGLHRACRRSTLNIPRQQFMSILVSAAASSIGTFLNASDLQSSYPRRTNDKAARGISLVNTDTESLLSISTTHTHTYTHTHTSQSCSHLEYSSQKYAF